jgi:ubiquinone/menaquinone biosynthesis C-methylase UbiE
MFNKIKRVPLAILRRLGVAKHTWKDVETFDESWRRRIQIMAGLVTSDARSILDVGCGRMWLREYLPRTCEYRGVDYVSRGDGCLVCDLNRHEFPPESVDVVFISGCLEYVEDYRWFLRTVAGCVRKQVILSYCVLDRFDNMPQRRASAWLSDLSEATLLSECEMAGLRLVTKTEAPSGDRIYVFEPKAGQS